MPALAMPDLAKPDLAITGRVLFLAADPALIHRQLAGEDLDHATATPLRDDVSTDEITPTTIMLTYDERLARYAYLGFQAGAEHPIPEGAIERGNFQVTVAGRRYGKGSSRESSPLAERSAGIRLIVAESFERIYRQNCDNIGIATTTDFTVLDLIREGRPIPLDRLLDGRDAMTRDVIRAGGLLPWSRGLAITSPPTAGQGPQTLAAKIIARHQAHPPYPVSPGDGVVLHADWRFSHDYFTGMVAHILHQAFGAPAPLTRPDGIIVFQDHMTLAPQSAPHQHVLPAIAELHDAHRRMAADYPIRHHGQLPGEPGAEGICHAILAERYALPGQVVIGTDSHTPHSGALGCLAFGAGATDVANSWATGLVRCRTPDSVLVHLHGTLGPGVSARDAVQHLLRLPTIRDGHAIGAVFEFAGPTVAAMGIDERATLCNMVAEMGGFSGIVAPDETTLAWLRHHRGDAPAIEPWMRSDDAAPYLHRINIDCATLHPLVAMPGDPGRTVEAESLDRPVPIDIAYAGSCTSAKQHDFAMMHEVLRWGLDHGRRVPASTRFVVQFSSLAVRDHARAAGWLDTFVAAGAELVSPGCGACNNCGPGQTTAPGQVAISSINRNFPGRSGPGATWLASPYTVAASALAGYVTSFPALQAGGAPPAPAA